MSDFKKETKPEEKKKASPAPVAKRPNHKDAKKAEGKQASWAQIQNIQRGLTLDGKKRT